MGSLYQGYTQYQTQKTQAKQAEINAQHAAEVGAQRAEAEKVRRETERGDQNESYRRRRAQQEASYARSGVLLDGTPSAYLTEQAETDELSVQRQDQASEQKRIGYLYQGLSQSVDYQNQADAYKYSSNASLISSPFNASSASSRSGSK